MPYIKDIDLTHRVLGCSASSPLKYFIYLTKQQSLYIYTYFKYVREEYGTC